jgi:hypothetical protein
VEQEDRVTDVGGNVMCALGIIEKEIRKMGGYIGAHLSIDVGKILSVTVGINFDDVRLREYIAQLPEEYPGND